jgi:tetratricopeptide (TPR) repeat protein
MPASQKKKPSAQKQLIERRILIASGAILLLGIAVVLWILNSQGIIHGSWSNALSIIFTFLGVLIGLFQWLFPVQSGEPSGEAVHSFFLPQSIEQAQASSGQQPVLFQLHQLATEAPARPASTYREEKASYRGILGLPPPTDPRTIQQRDAAVKEVYEQLIQSNRSAIVLTGIGGVGKSTLAALVYQHAEAQRQAKQGPFTEPAIWLNIDPSVTMADLAGNLCEIFGRPLPDFSHLSLQHQALTLCNILNTPDEARLLVLDQFENLLDWQTGRALTDRPGVGEWLDALNSQPCHSRLLMTTRPWPLGTREYPPTCMQEYSVKGLNQSEGIDFLRKSGIEGDDQSLSIVVERCGGHAFALTLVISLLHTRKLTLAAFFNDGSYKHVWTGNVARNLLDEIYTSQLNDTQRKLLLAFSVYREPVPLAAARAIYDFKENVSLAQLQQALDALLAQHLLQAVGDGNYQLHAIVEGYAQDNFAIHDEQANRRALRQAHAKAAQYYTRLAAKSYPPHGKREQLSDYDPLIEAVWQLCQAHRWREAYNQIVHEDLFSDLKNLGGVLIILELYKLLFPLKKWQAQPQEGARIYNHLGSIYRSLGRRELAFQHIEQAIVLCKEAGDRIEEGWSLNHLGRLYESIGEKERARAYFDEVLERARTGQDSVLEGAALNNLGWIYSAWGRKDLEQQSFEEALRVYRKIGDRTGEAATLNNLGRVAEDLGQFEQALKYSAEALEIFKQLHNRMGMGWSLNNLGRACLLDNHSQRAREYLEEALPIRREVDRKGEGHTLNNLGAAYAQEGNYEQAWTCYMESLEITEELTDNECRAKVWRNLGQYYHLQHHNPEALAFLLSAKTILDEVQSPGREKIQQDIDKLHHEVGDEEFFTLLAHVEPRSQVLVEQCLKGKSA